MPRRRQHAPLRIYLNNRLVGHLTKEPGGAIGFHYDASWLGWRSAIPVSLSLPLREDAYRGAPVAAVFENLLPDSDALRRRVAAQVGAAGSDAYSLLAAIGRDCVGALQFIEGDNEVPDAAERIEGEAVNEAAIEKLLRSLSKAPLGLSRDDPFRISVAGAQEKTALLRHRGRWLKPTGTTPTTHIFKTQIGELPNGIDLTHSVENEYYSLKLAAAFGLPVNAATIGTFGETRALVVERFDRRWAADGRLLRIPQEDCCQALSVPPARKYQSDGGPGLTEILDLLKGSDTPAKDQKTVLKAQLVFYLTGATDGHAKNFSVFLGPSGTYRLTPLYDILTAQPSLDARQIERRQMRLAMAVGHSRHYRIDTVRGWHFLETAADAGVPSSLIREAVDDVTAVADYAIERIEGELPKHFPERIHASVKSAVARRLRMLTSA
jgi:serine/threonine-protein kinase HipA